MLASLMPTFLVQKSRTILGEEIEILNFLNGLIPDYFFFIFVYSTDNSTRNKFNIKFQLQTSVWKSDCSANWAATAVQ